MHPYRFKVASYKMVSGEDSYTIASLPDFVCKHAAARMVWGHAPQRKIRCSVILQQRR